MPVCSRCRFPFKLARLIFQLALVALSMCFREEKLEPYTHRSTVERRLRRDFVNRTQAGRK